MANHVLPAIGEVAVAELTTVEVAKIASALVSTPSAAKFAMSYIERVCGWAIDNGHREAANPATGPNRQIKVPVRKHATFLPVEDVAPALARIEASGCGLSVSLAIRFLALTAKRLVEVRRASWDQMDLEAAEWMIPGDAETKIREGHVVPLSDAALDVLERARELGNGKGVQFPGGSAAGVLPTTVSIRFLSTENVRVKPVSGRFVAHDAGLASVCGAASDARMGDEDTVEALPGPGDVEGGDVEAVRVERADDPPLDCRGAAGRGSCGWASGVLGQVAGAAQAGRLQGDHRGASGGVPSAVGATAVRRGAGSRLRRWLQPRAGLRARRAPARAGRGGGPLRDAAGASGAGGLRRRSVTRLISSCRATSRARWIEPLTVTGSRGLACQSCSHENVRVARNRPLHAGENARTWV